MLRKILDERKFVESLVVNHNKRYPGGLREYEADIFRDIFQSEIEEFLDFATDEPKELSPAREDQFTSHPTFSSEPTITQEIFLRGLRAAQRGSEHKFSKGSS